MAPRLSGMQAEVTHVTPWRRLHSNHDPNPLSMKLRDPTLKFLIHPSVHPFFTSCDEGPLSTVNKHSLRAELESTTNRGFMFAEGKLEKHWENHTERPDTPILQLN